MGNNLFTIELDIRFPTRKYKSLLKKLQTFISYIATVGIHQAEGKKKVLRRYTTKSSSNKTATRISGKSHRMNVVKLAYQNEFGANILIKPKYRKTTRTRRIVINKKYTRMTRTVKYTYDDLAKEQGYLLLNKSGKFVAYFKPGTMIRIPPRPFLTRILKEKNSKLSHSITGILFDTFMLNKYSSNQSIDKIAKLVQYRAKNNVKNNISNRSLTFKAKGHRIPLFDEQDRITKAIKYKIYKNTQAPGSKGLLSLQNQTIKHIDKLLNSANVFEQTLSEASYSTKVFRYKGLNPHYKK